MKRVPRVCGRNLLTLAAFQTLGKICEWPTCLKVCPDVLSQNLAAFDPVEIPRSLGWRWLEVGALKSFKF